MRCGANAAARTIHSCGEAGGPPSDAARAASASSGEPGSSRPATMRRPLEHVQRASSTPSSRTAAPTTGPPPPWVSSITSPRRRAHASTASRRRWSASTVRKACAAGASVAHLQARAARAGRSPLPAARADPGSRRPRSTPACRARTARRAVAREPPPRPKARPSACRGGTCAGRWRAAAVSSRPRPRVRRSRRSSAKPAARSNQPHGSSGVAACTRARSSAISGGASGSSGPATTRRRSKPSSRRPTTSMCPPSAPSRTTRRAASSRSAAVPLRPCVRSMASPRTLGSYVACGLRGAHVRLRREPHAVIPPPTLDQPSGGQTPLRVVEGSALEQADRDADALGRGIPVGSAHADGDHDAQLALRRVPQCAAGGAAERLRAAQPQPHRAVRRQVRRRALETARCARRPSSSRSPTPCTPPARSRPRRSRRACS